MSLFATAEFDVDALTPAAARRWVSDLLEQWELPAWRERVSLLLSELVTNAVRHAESPSVVTVALADGVLEVAVTDREPGRLPRLCPDVGPDAEGGRGLAIVEGVANEWGTSLLPDGKKVWFRLQLAE
jgi:anti-sigma regulatory factor (Ser/Thr protein kinase)